MYKRLVTSKNINNNNHPQVCSIQTNNTPIDEEANNDINSQLNLSKSKNADNNTDTDENGNNYHTDEDNSDNITNNNRNDTIISNEKYAICNASTIESDNHTIIEDSYNNDNYNINSTANKTNNANKHLNPENLNLDNIMNYFKAELSSYIPGRIPLDDFITNLIKTTVLNSY
jgi:hypothetical protein